MSASTHVVASATLPLHLFLHKERQRVLHKERQRGVDD